MERKSEDIPLLVAQEGLLNGQRWALRNRLIIGRDASCDIVVADRQVSRRHARLTPTPNGILLEDLGSKNGTNRNGEPLSDSVILLDGDSIQIALSPNFPIPELRRDPTPGWRTRLPLSRHGGQPACG